MKQAPKRPQVRCAIYTRKSTEEGLDQEFNTLDAQRESGEAYIASQKHDGWVCLSDRYDDGGFSGGNMDRPALKRLFTDIEAGKVDCVVVYKVDRLSRSLLDFARMMEVFDRHKVSFVSVTQQFNTAASMGRLILNVLLSFAQFEREMISERTRDKIAATRRKGKWTGGMPLLGFDVVDSKLVVNQDEAERVRQIFDLYLERESLLSTAGELNHRGWTTKEWTTKKGVRRGGLPFGKTNLHQLLTNVTYLGKIRYKDEVHEGEHEGLIGAELFQRVQETLASKASNRRGTSSMKSDALLAGLLRCSACDCGMVHTYTTKGNRRYRYYVCAHAQQKRRSACPVPSVAAGEIERFVVDEIRGIGRDPDLVAATLDDAERQTDEAVRVMKAERATLARQIRQDEVTRRSLSGDSQQFAEVEIRLLQYSKRSSEIDDELDRLVLHRPTLSDVSASLAQFDNVWNALSPKERRTAMALLLDQIDFDGADSKITLRFRSAGLLTHSVRTEEEVSTA